MGKLTIHPIIYLGKKDVDSFIGCIVTHSNTKSYKNNIAFLPEHFEKSDKYNEYKMRYDDSYFVNLSLIKKNEWGPFRKVGKLSGIGIKFIENHLKNSFSILWDEYIYKNK